MSWRAPLPLSADIITREADGVLSAFVQLYLGRKPMFLLPFDPALLGERSRADICEDITAAWFSRVNETMLRHG